MSARPLGRVGDRAVGPRLGDVAVAGSANVLVNGIAALRHGDHGAEWVAAGGAAHVLVNGKLAFRVADATASRTGKLVKGSPNVLVGDAGSGGKVAAFVAPKGKVALSAVEARPKKPGWFKRALAAVWKGVKRVAKAVVLAGVAAKALGGTAWKLVKDVLKWLAYAVTAGLQWLIMGAWRFPKIGDCPGPSGDPAPTVAGTLPQAFVDAQFQSDVTESLGDVLNVFRPIVYQDPEDIHPVKLEELLTHSVVRTIEGTEVVGAQASLEVFHATLFGAGPPYGAGGSSTRHYLDVDNEYARLRGKRPATVYARAIKLSASAARLEYNMIRPGSYMPWPLDPYLYFEHEGDGEGCMLYVENSADAWKLAGAYFGGHDNDELPCCACRCAAQGNRVKVYVARGSHATAPSAEPRKYFEIAIDTFDSEHELEYELRYRGDGTMGVTEHESVFTKRCTWGTPSVFAPEGPMIKTKSYGGYGEVPVATGSGGESESLECKDPC